MRKLQSVVLVSYMQIACQPDKCIKMQEIAGIIARGEHATPQKESGDKNG